MKLSRLVHFSLSSVTICITGLSGSAAFPAGPPQHHVQPPATNAQEITVVITGDIVPEAEFKTRMPPAGQLYTLVRSTLGAADIAFGNLEEPLTKSDQVTPYKDPEALAHARDFVLRAPHPVQVSEALRKAGFTILGLANNHMMDYGEAGLDDTLAALHAVGIEAVGAGQSQSLAERGYVMEVKGVRLAFLAFSDVVPLHYGALEGHPGVASSKDSARLAAALQRIRGRADVVVLMMHWGGHATHVVIPRQVELATLAIDSGADIVVGTHPHYLQGISFYRGKPILYSIGNFQFPTRNPQAQQSVLVQLKLVGKELKELRLIPVWIDHGQPRLVDGTRRGKDILRTIARYSRMFGTGMRTGRVTLPSEPVR